MSNVTDIESVMFVADMLINLKLNLKEIDVSDPSKVSYFRMFSNKLKKLDMKDKVQPFEKLMNLIIQNTKKRFHDFDPKLICHKSYFKAIYSLMILFP